MSWIVLRLNATIGHHVFGSGSTKAIACADAIEWIEPEPNHIPCRHAELTHGDVCAVECDDKLLSDSLVSGYEAPLIISDDGRVSAMQGSRWRRIVLPGLWHGCENTSYTVMAYDDG